MIISPGATSQSITIQIVDDSGLAVTGLVANTFPSVYYQRVAEAAVSISLSDLALITSTYSSGGVKETNGGYYRLDIPDAAFVTASKVRITGEASGKHLLYPPITCAYVGVNTVQVGGTIAADAILTAGDIDGYNIEETLKLCLAVLAGKVSGSKTGTIVIRAVDDSKPRVTATADSNGNRTATTLDAT